MPDLTWQQKMMLFGQGLSGGNPMATRAAWENQAMQKGLFQQQMEEEERKRQEGMLQSGIQSMAMQPQRGPGQAVDVSALGPEGMELMKSRGMLTPAAGGTGYMEAPRPEIALARSQMAMEAATTTKATKEAEKETAIIQARQDLAANPTDDTNLRKLYYLTQNNPTPEGFALNRTKLTLEGDTLGRIAKLQSTAMELQATGKLQSVSMGPESIGFSLLPPRGEAGGTGDTFNDLSKTLEGFNNVRERLVTTHAQMRKLPQEQAKIRAELALVGMKEFMALAAVPGPIVEGRQTPNPYVLEMLNAYAPHLDVDLKTLKESGKLNDPNFIVTLAYQIGQASATVALGPKEAAAAEISRWRKAMAWMKGMGKGSDTGTAKSPSDEERYRRVKRGISRGQRQ